ncbi:MAG TPA: tetratricopeptide repeat protein [Candidatus Dormibacteraeota bacterium]|nr:tetratricopeptide repeat protein [Candidatus Dormibacteraeota bacterium]
MATPPPDEASAPQSRFSSSTRLATWILAATAVVYALLAGLHTLQDFDLGWQLATGRWVVQHHRVFSADVFSYTAAGQPWIYPAFSGVIFYIAFLAGGYALLSWLGALASAGTVALLLRPDRLAVSAALAVLAAPLIANRTQPRAEMFTTVLFAAFLTLLWKYYRTGRSALWLLPILMVLWVNLHPGFVAGLALSAGYLLLEALDLLSSQKREAALARLRHAWPWLAATCVATLLNPWGPLIYSALVRQQRAQALHNLWVVEWESVRLSWASLHQALGWRDPQSSFWWLLVAVIVSVVFALWRRQWGAALWLAGAAYLAMRHVRLQALFACVVVVVGGLLLDEFARATAKQFAGSRKIPTSRAKNAREMGHPAPFNTRFKLAALVVLTTFLVLLSGVRSADLISNRYYLRSSQLSSFGAGLSGWFPERAVDFVEREKLPANVFNGYSLGGYLTWRLFPAYPDYIDSRALPFGPELFFRAYDLAAQPPNSVTWQQEADARGINTIVIPLSRYQGMTLFPQLHAFCRSKAWRPVYLDEVSGVFVRVTPQNASLLDRLQIDCDTTSFHPPGAAPPARDKAVAFNFWANAGGVLYSLERYPEALENLDRAQSIFGDNASVHLLRALVLKQTGRAAEAEAEFRTSLSLEPSDEAWMDFGLFFMGQRRYDDAVNLFRSSAESSSRPHEMWMMLGQAYLQMHQPEPALDALDKAVASSPFHEEGEAMGGTFNSMVATGRAKAWYQLGDAARAVSYQEEAVQFAPNDAKLWLGLANLYEVQGRVTKAAEARLRANWLGAH